MDIRNSKMGPKKIVKKDMVISLIQHGTREILCDRHMQHCLFLKATCDISIPVYGPKMWEPLRHRKLDSECCNSHQMASKGNPLIIVHSPL